jgi:hypothetical protein
MENILNSSNIMLRVYVISYFYTLMEPRRLRVGGLGNDFLGSHSQPRVQLRLGSTVGSTAQAAVSSITLRPCETHSLNPEAEFV